MWVQRLLGLLNLWFRVFCCPPKGNDRVFLHSLMLCLGIVISFDNIDLTQISVRQTREFKFGFNEIHHCYKSG